MIQVGDKILVRSGNGLAKAIVVEVSGKPPTTAYWQMSTNQGRSTLEGWVTLAQIGITWTEGWSQESFHLLRFLRATERW